MNLIFDFFHQDPHFLTMFCILAGAFLVGLFYFYQADKEYERQAANEWEEISNSFADPSRMADIPTVMRIEHAASTPPLLDVITN